MYRGSRLTLVLLCTTFIANGLVIAALGPALPELARQAGRSLAQMGTLFIPLFGAGLLAQFVAGWIADRFGRRVVLVAASAMFGLGTLAMSLATHLWAIIGFATILGFGYAGCSLSVNVLSSELTPHRRASTVNLVNVFYAVGAIAGPLLAAAALERWGTPIPAMQFGALLTLIVSPCAAFVALPTRPTRHAASIPSRSRVDDVGHVPAYFVWSCAAVLLLYVGSEASVGSWAPVYLRRSTGVDAAAAATITSIFWASLCAGRVLATIGGLHMSAGRLLVVSFCGAIVGAALLAAGHGFVWLSAIALAILGLSYAPIYPTMMAVVTALYPRTAATAASRLGALASIGGMALPALHGLLISRVGTWTTAVVTLVAAIGMLTGWLAIRRLMRAHDVGVA